jgi:fructan beta-fructosidase
MLFHLSPERQAFRKPWLCGLMMLWLTVGFRAGASVSYSYVDLIGTLTNLEHLAELPSAGEKSAEWTSHDRASTYDANSGQYLNWNANNDGTGNLGTQADGGIVMAQMNGPGCIWRMWSAQVGTGRVKIFLEGSNAPAVDLAFQDYFNRSHFPFNYPSLTYSVCGGFDSYLPIPYNQSCKIVAYGAWGQYFHFNYSTFGVGVTVPTFTTNLTADEQTALSNVNDFFVNHLGSDPAGARSGEVTITNSYAIHPGKTVTNLNLSGPGAITTFKVRVGNIDETNASWQALRDLTVSMYWDGEAVPSVWAPLGDFFGSSCGYIPYKALSLGMETGGWMYSFWYMPFASGAQIVLGNDGSITRNVDVVITYGPLSRPIANLARFHAKWNRGAYVTNNGRSPDYRFLSATGQGRFVGLSMHIYQKVDFSPGPWWGEGDEKFFVDGETMPSWFGTGSEDYFGFAWGTPGYFSQPYHSQLLAPPGNLFAPGNRALNRFHITDNVPFQTSFDGCIEKWQYTNESVTSYGVLPYWYLKSGGGDSYSAQPLNVRTTYYVPNDPQFVSSANVMNYGADGNDYFQFSTPSMAFDKASGFTTLVAFAMHVDADGTLEIGGGPVCSNGVYIGPSNWVALVNTLKTSPTTVNRYEVGIGGWLDTSYDNVKSLVQSQGAGPGSILFRNFQALKNAVPGIDAINDDDEKTYDLGSTVSFANMLGSLGYKFTTAPYTAQSFWVYLNNSITNCDYIYLQCYSGGAGNDPTQWNTAFGNGVKVVPGQESSAASPSTFRNWYLQTGAQGGFYYPDVVFGSTYWSASIIEADGSIPSAPTGLATTVAGNKVKLSWGVVPGAISYNVKRSTASDAEVTVANISTANNPWPASNLFFDSAPVGNTTNYYKVSAVNTNGESANSLEASAIAPILVAWFKADALTNLANNASVAIWPDSSGFGSTAIQTIISQRPTLLVGALNGLPVVHFESTNNQVITFNRVVQDDFTIFCVFRSSQGLSSGNQFSDGAGLVSATVAGTTNDFGTCLFANGQVCAGTGNPDSSVRSMSGFNDGRPHLLVARRTKSSGLLELFIDGNFAGSVTGNTNSLKTAVKIALGAQLTLNNFFAGDIAEVKIYNGPLADPDRLAQESILFQKWGVTGASIGLLAYEGFNYPAGDVLGGKFGGIGWSNVWVDLSGTASGAVNPGNLLAGNRAPGGFDVRSSGNSAFVGNNSRVGRWLDCSTNGTFAQAGYLNASGNIGAPGKTLYVSFLQQPNNPAQFYELEFHRGNLGDPGRIAGIGNDLANATTVNLRAPNAVHTPFALGDTNANFYVVRIDYHGGSDSVYVYRNPTGSSESDNQPALTMLNVADMSFNGISLAAYLNGVTVNHDEIRLGTTWASALGNPLSFTTQPANQLAYVGQTVTIPSLALSSQPLGYQWYHGDSPLANQTNASLTLSDVQLADAGQYFVTASNVLGAATSATAVITVQTVSVDLFGPASIPIGPGSNVVIGATVGGALPLTLQWYKDGISIPGATSPTLALGSNGFFDAGRYLMVASNLYGCVTSTVVTVFSNFGGLLAYDGFNYGQSSSDIAGANGGFGWAGAWASLNGPQSQSFSNSLTGGINAPIGFDSHSLDGLLTIANSSRKGRFLDCSPAGNFAEHGYIDGNGLIGADGTTLYLSFLQQPSSTSPFYEFELKRGDLGDGGRIGGIGNDVGSGNNHANLRIQSPPGGNSSFYDLGPGDTNVNFYVLRIDYHAGNDSVTVYRNPTSATEPAIPTLALANIADLSFNGISFGAYLNGVTVSHDEVRVGMTWADVVGNAVSELQATQTNNALRLLLAGSPNYSYQLQESTNVPGPWTNIGTVTVPNLGVGQWTETNVVNDHRFYRALNGLTASSPQSTDFVIADFEQSTYGGWLATGTAFGSGPAEGTLPGQQTVSSFAGSGLVNSYLGSDTSTGTLTSPPFIVTHSYLNFLIGGGNLSGQECMNLIVSNVVVATATGANSETLTPMQWDVGAYLGQTATLQIVDSATGGWGHLLVDQIVLSDAAFPALSRTMLLTNNLLNLPVKNGAAMKRVTVTSGGKALRDFNIQLANGTPDWWAFVDVSAFSNQTATVSVNSLSPGSSGLSSIVQSNGIVGATNLYAEALRPQLHFSSKRGWLNDANGMFYDNGQYHLYYQHDPFNRDGSGQKWWGHAVSPDMVNWQELPEGIYSHTYGDDVWSGSAVVDTANSSGLQSGTNSVIAAAFYSTARGECMAFSTNGGLSFFDLTNNPVAVHAGQGRDPHLFWYAPSNYWCMAVYDDAGGNGVQFYSSSNLRDWTFRSKIYNGFFECPDMFQLPVAGNPSNRMWVLCDASGVYQLGQFDGAVFTPATAKFPCQFGSGFYASQTFTSMKPGDNRVVRMAWAQISTPGMPFNQLMYFPTVLTLQTNQSGVRLCSTPVAEITNNTVNVYTWTNLTLNPGYNPLSGIRGKLFDLKTQLSAGTAQSVSFAFQGTTVTYNASSQQISCNGDTQSLPLINGSVQLEIIVDWNTIEIFGNNGQLYMPLPANNSAGNSLISLTCTGGNASFNSLTVNKLKSIWTDLSN